MIISNMVCLGFRSLFQRRGNSKNLVLDESVIPKRYVRVILHCMYTDRIDLSLIDPSRSGLTEVESLTFTGRLNPAGFEEAMELYQIGMSFVGSSLALYEF
jgi:BTB/POZ domain-containing protein 7